MRFSIVVPIFKVEKYIRKCIESILSQNFNDYELILVDDGSPDSCGEICDEYAQKDSKIVVVHKENGGLVSARKTGLQIAKGEYLINIDGDDFIEQGYLAKIDKLIRKNNPDVIAVGCTWWSEEIQQYLTNSIKDGMYVGEALDEIKDNIICTLERRRITFGCLLYSSWSKISRIAIVRPIQEDIPNDITIGEDFAVTIQLINACKSLYIDSTINEYCYRKNNTSMINSWKEEEYGREILLFVYIYQKITDDQIISLDGYMFLITIRYIIAATKNVNSYSEFDRIIHENVPIEIINEIKKIQLPAIKDKCICFLLTRRCYRLLYIWYRRKRGRNE